MRETVDIVKEEQKKSHTTKQQKNYYNIKIKNQEHFLYKLKYNVKQNKHLAKILLLIKSYKNI